MNDNISDVDLLPRNSKYLIVFMLGMAVLSIISLVSVVLIMSQPDQHTPAKDAQYKEFKKCMEDQTTGINCSGYLLDKKPVKGN